MRKNIRHRIKSFVWLPSPHRAYLCYCPNELMMRVYKADLLTGVWVELMRMQNVDNFSVGWVSVFGSVIFWKRIHR